MKKSIALLAVCGFALAFVACGKKAETATSTEDTTAVVEQTPDTAAAGTDTVKTDTTAH